MDKKFFSNIIDDVNRYDVYDENLNEVELPQIKEDIINLEKNILNLLKNKASIKIWNIVNDGKADNTGKVNADSIFDDAFKNKIKEYDYIYIPNGNYLLTNYYICTSNILINKKALEKNKNHLLATEEIQYGSNAFSLYKSHKKESDGYSIQGFWIEPNETVYLGARKNDNTSNQVRLLNKFLDTTSTWTFPNFGHINSICKNSKNQYFICPIAPYVALVNDFSTGNIVNYTVNGISNNIDLMNIINDNLYVMLEEITNKIHIVKFVNNIFTSIHSFTITFPKDIKQVGSNGLCYYKGNIYYGITDNGVGYGINRNYIQIYDLNGDKKTEWVLNDNYEAKEIEGFQVVGDEIIMAEYGNSSLFTDKNTISFWRINPNESGLEVRNTSMNYQGMVGKMNIYVNSNNSNYGNGSNENPFKSLQSAIDFASQFQAVVLFIEGTFNEDIILKSRTERIEFNGGILNGHIQLDGNREVSFTNVTFNYSGTYQIVSDHSSVSFNQCSINMVGGSSGNGFINATGLSTIEFIKSNVVARNLIYSNRGTLCWVNGDCSGTLYNCFYNGGIVIGDISNITHTYVSTNLESSIIKVKGGNSLFALADDFE